MKRFICISLICLAINSGGFSQSVKRTVSSATSQDVIKESQQVKKVSEKVVYTCPMHPEILKDKPGKCPTCGMNLIKKEPVKKTSQKMKGVAEVMYTCPMHPKVLTNKPGKCPTCGMNLVKKEIVKQVEPKKK